MTTIKNDKYDAGYNKLVVNKKGEHFIINMYKANYGNDYNIYTSDKDGSTIELIKEGFTYWEVKEWEKANNQE